MINTVPTVILDEDVVTEGLERTTRGLYMTEVLTCTPHKKSHTRRPPEDFPTKSICKRCSHLTTAGTLVHNSAFRKYYTWGYGVCWTRSSKCTTRNASSVHVQDLNVVYKYGNAIEMRSRWAPAALCAVCCIAFSLRKLACRTMMPLYPRI